MADYLYVGPVSREVLEAAASINDRRLRLCCSEGQVGPDSYTGIKLTDLLKYPRMHSERDHAGRNGAIANAAKQWDKIDSTVIDGIHLHVFDVVAEIEACRLRGDAFCPEEDVQIGPGEDNSYLMTLPRDVSDWRGWVSFPAGPLVAGGRSNGAIDEALVAQFRAKFPRARLRLHNADFISREQWQIASKLFDGINVAPMLGAMQSSWYIQGTMRGRDATTWRLACVEDSEQQERWALRPWLWYHVGHYHFDQIAWRDEVKEQVIIYIANCIREVLSWL